ncbi:MAG: aldo/keto reductase [Verrucomicrobiota bacterium]
MNSSNEPLVPRRPFGGSGSSLSVIGMGGIVVMGAEQAHADHIVAEFVERGGGRG